MSVTIPATHMCVCEKKVILFILILVAVLFLVVVYKGFDYDPLAQVAPDWSMKVLEEKGTKLIGTYLNK